MRSKIAAVGVLCLFAAATALAQEEIEGAGTPGYVPLFTGYHRVGNSNILQSPDGNIGIGTTTPVWPLQVISTRTTGTTDYPSPITFWVENTAPNSGGAIWALASSPTGQTIALNGENSSPDGIGVIGNHTSSGGGGGGVIGQTYSSGGFSYGARGDALGTTGPAVGIFGAAWSPQGIAGLFINIPRGDILRGAVSQNPDVTVFRVDGTGRVFADGGFQPGGADFAESMAATGDRAQYAAGDLLVIDPTASRHVALAQKPYSTLVAGIYSTKPGLVGTTRKVDESAPQNEIPLAVVGIVPCKVTTENGPIQIGDLLVTSSTPGHAMKGTERSKMLGAVVGKALEPLEEGKGVIQVLVTLQ
jgi:hypothetical protein